MTTDLALDPPGLHSPRHHLGNATSDAVWLQLTHCGIPVWGCQNAHCEKVTVAGQEPKVCPGCGEEDLLGPVFHNRSYGDDAYINVAFVTPEPDEGRVVDRHGDVWWRNQNPDFDGWTSSDEIVSWVRLLTECGPLYPTTN